MKRLVAVLVVVALVMTGAFAQISFGGYGSAVFGVKGGAGAEDVTTFGQAAWGGIPRYGFTLRGSSDNIGFVVDMHADTKDIVVNENAYIWWKANDVVKVNFGMVQGDVLRGKIGDWAEFRGVMGNMSNADSIFTRFYPKNGTLVEITPIDGLYIGAAMDFQSYNSWDEQKTVKVPVKDYFDTTFQVGAGYDVADVGFFRVQYIAAYESGIVEFAYAPSFIDGVTLDIGMKYPLDDVKAFNPNEPWNFYKFAVAAGAAFNIDAVAVTTRVDAKIKEKASTIDFWATPSYGLDFATIGMDVNVNVATADGADAEVGFAVAPWISKGYSNGSVKAGVALTKAGTKDAKMGWAIPVALTYWF